MESAELIALLREVRERVEARHPQGSAPGNVPLADLLPLLHARDAALGKVASIGTVNPRPPGLANALVQRWKRLIARLLDWHIRDQIVFNRSVVECIDATLEALNENNRSLNALAGRIQDLNDHWAAWRAAWEQKLNQTEVQFLRSVAELQAAVQQRIGAADAAFEEKLGEHAAEMAGLLRESHHQMRLEFERLIHTELRLLRQRAAAGPVDTSRSGDRPSRSVPETRPVLFDYTRFAERFRGTEEYVQANQRVYLPYFQNRRHVLDIGCGRGEFLDLMRSAGVPARGIDLNPECAALCRQKGLAAEAADLFEFLARQPEAAFDGIFCAQLVEHLPPEHLPEMLKLAVSRLAPGGVMAIETPNPECLAIFATHFYLDPTHTRPIPHPLLVFYLEEFGVGGIEVRKLAPAVESMPSLASLPADFREAFFGGLDYAVIGQKLEQPASEDRGA